jgi:hypothetical protein
MKMIKELHYVKLIEKHKELIEIQDEFRERMIDRIIKSFGKPISYNQAMVEVDLKIDKLKSEIPELEKELKQEPSNLCPKCKGVGTDYYGDNSLCSNCHGSGIIHKPVLSGWICPRCGVVHNPFVTKCDCPPPIRTGTGTTTDNNNILIPDEK